MCCTVHTLLLCACHSRSRHALTLCAHSLYSHAKEWIPVRNPATQEVVTLVPQATRQELEYAARSAADAFKLWRQTSVLTRQRAMLDLQLLVRNHSVICACVCVRQR